MKADMTEVRKVLEDLKKMSAALGIEPGEFAGLEKTIDKVDKKNRKQEILNAVATTMSQFFYYDRKEDEDLPLGAIQDAVRAGEITEDQLIKAFTGQIQVVMREAGI